VDSAVRIGLSRVFGLTQTTGERIVAASGTRLFANLADVLDRARPALPEVESLILAGALDWTGRSRPSLLLEARTGAKVWGAARAATPALVAAGGGVLESAPVAPIATPDLPEFDTRALVRGEAQATGLWFSGHPLDVLAPADALRGVVPAAEIERHVGRRIAVVGLPCAYRRVETKQGGLMLFMTLADKTGLVECVLFPDAFRAYASVVRGQVVRAEGRVDETLGAVTVSVERARALSA
jgi:DNA polymerase III alpha subunit